MNSYHIYYTEQSDPLSQVQYIELKADSISDIFTEFGKIHIFEMWCNGSKVDVSLALSTEAYNTSKTVDMCMT